MDTSRQRAGGQSKYSNLAIESALTLGLVDHLPLRQTEGFVAAIFKLMGLHLDVPDHTTLSRRSLHRPNVDDAKTGVRMIKNARNKVKAVIGDAAYDSREIYDAAEDHGARGVVPPIKDARVNRHSPQARNRSVKRVAKVGRQRWKTEVGYHRQGKVENTFFRYKTTIGDRLRSRDPNTQETEVILGCNILNRRFECGRPRSAAIRD